MYNIVKQNIQNGGFKLSDIQHKIKKLYMLGDIDETQLDELLNLASGGATVNGERPDQNTMLETIYKMLIDIDRRVTTLENGGESEGETGSTETEYPEWKPWDGLSKDYAYGKIVQHNGKLWQSTYQGQNVWEPGALGIDERYWVEYDPDMENKTGETL